MAGIARPTTGNGLPNVVVTGIAMTTALATDAENTCGGERATGQVRGAGPAVGG